MKRKSLILVIFIITTMCLLAGCNNEDLKTERSELQTEIDELQTDVDRLQEVRDGLIQKDEIIYVIELEISQSHFSLDLEEHMKDYMNTITISIQVSEEYYYSVEIGDILDDEFRIGSYVFKGSIGSWQIKVVDKKIVEN